MVTPSSPLPHTPAPGEQKPSSPPQSHLGKLFEQYIQSPVSKALHWIDKQVTPKKGDDYVFMDGPFIGHKVGEVRRIMEESKTGEISDDSEDDVQSINSTTDEETEVTVSGLLEENKQLREEIKQLKAWPDFFKMPGEFRFQGGQLMGLTIAEAREFLKETRAAAKTETPKTESPTSEELEKLRNENAALKAENEHLKKALSSGSSSREVKLEALVRLLASKGLLVSAREPFAYSPEQLSVPFVEKALAKLSNASEPWFIRETIEKDGKKIMTSRLTEAGQQAVPILEKLGLIEPTVRSEGGVLYVAKPRWDKEKAFLFLKREFLEWAGSENELVVDVKKPEGFLDLSAEDSNSLLNNYLTGQPAKSRPAQEQLGMPDRDQLLQCSLDLARVKALAIIKERADELFENAQDKQCMQNPTADFATYDALQAKQTKIQAAAEEGKGKQATYYQEQKARAEEIRAEHALIEAVLAGKDMPTEAVAPPPPPPPPPPPK